ncbi:MAG: alpha-glucuronidase family glycosyl hydrolase [Acidobacteriaceae bacterium]|jgi:alpha-glucuronidase
MRTLLILAGLLATASLGHAETGANGWLRYSPLPDAARRQYAQMPGRVVSLDDSPIGQSAVAEIKRGVHSMLGRDLAQAQRITAGDAIVIGTANDIHATLPAWSMLPSTRDQGFSLAAFHSAGHTYWIVAGKDDRGELYAVFHLLEQIAEQRPFVNDTESPAAPIRWVDQWDNFDGTIERGYAGRSIFFSDGHVRPDLTRVSDYGRLLASIGLNGCTVNNVNANLHTLDPAMLKELARIADAFRPWGVRMSLAVDLSSPQVVGGLPTFDPVDPAVAAWWQQKVDEIYRLIPDFGGFVVKADSEGRAGPSQYGRTPAQAANVLARALAPHDGIVMYRGFVYDHHLDWTNLKADRARAGYDDFHALDGQFEPNVVIQIKNGPIDFQVREPVSPLFAALRHTNEAIEVETTQEYTGQQRHMVFLVPMWKAALDTDMRADDRSTPVKEIVEGKSFHRPLGGFVSVVNVGLEDNWLHHPMAMANLYGFGKLAWNPNLTSEAIIDSWTCLTFGNDPRVDATVERLQLESWHAYEQYTGPLGLGTLTDIIGVHYGPGIESAERNGWGQWIRADHEGVGMDRTVATGTGYIGQYPPQLAAKYESLATCPDELLLFMHHVPYTHVLHSGKTVIQHVYDSHYDGAATAATYATEWTKLKGLVDEERYQKTLDLFTYQAGHAILWRDAVSEWFLKMSGIPDRQGRVGHYPDRIEAESMQADGYKPVDVTPWETASGGKAVICSDAPVCSLTTRLSRPAGTYSIAVQYFDLNDGKSSYQLLLNGKPVASWKADRSLPSGKLDGHTSTRFTVPRIHLAPGDTLTLRGTPDGAEPAPVDYIEISGPFEAI